MFTFISKPHKIIGFIYYYIFTLTKTQKSKDPMNPEVVLRQAVLFLAPTTLEGDQLMSGDQPSSGTLEGDQ